MSCFLGHFFGHWRSHAKPFWFVPSPLSMGLAIELKPPWCFTSLGSLGHFIFMDSICFEVKGVAYLFFLPLDHVAFNIPCDVATWHILFLFPQKCLLLHIQGVAISHKRLECIYDGIFKQLGGILNRTCIASIGLCCGTTFGSTPFWYQPYLNACPNFFVVLGKV